MKLCAEMKKLRDYLDSTCIPWEDNSETVHLPIERTHFFVKKNGCKWSVIHGYGTYGGWSRYDPIDKGLLELLAEDVNDGDPVGYLTAEDVIRLILFVIGRR